MYGVRERFIGPARRRQHVLEWNGHPSRSDDGDVAPGVEPANPLVLLHASGCHAGWWAEVAPELARRLACRVLAPDLRGHGDTEPSEDGLYGWDVFLRDVDALLDELELEEPILVGHSMGGFIALLYASRNREPFDGARAGDPREHARRGRALAGVVAADLLCEVGGETLERLHNASERPAPMFDSREAAVAAFRLVPAETSAPAEALVRLAEDAVRQAPDGAWTYKFDRRSLRLEPARLWDEAQHVTCPVLVLRGAQSALMTAHTAQRLAAALPDGREEAIPGAFHNLMLDQPALFIEAVVRFAAGSRGTRPQKQ
jgi:pimeloyl-ACP methyl ester carboxylesterase